MKVPTLTSTRTTSPGGGIGYTQPASGVGQGGQQIARSLGNLGDVFVQARGVLRERDDKLTRFNTMRDFSGFETSVANDLTDLKRNYAADGKGFNEAADKLYDKLETQFLNEKVSPDQYEEWRAKAGEVKQRVMADAMSFQYQAGDAWYKQGVDDQLNKAKTILDQDPKALAAQQQTMMDTIDATDLPEIEKENLKRNVNIALASVTYKAEVRNNPSTAASIGVGEPKTIVDKIIGAESGGRADAQNPNSSAGGLGQFIDSTWLAMVRKYAPDLRGLTDEEVIAEKSDPVLAREMTEKYTQENMATLSRAGITPSAGAVYLAHFLGPGGAVKLLKASPDTPVSEVVDQDSIAANKSVLEGKTVGEVRSWANKKMGDATLATDPRFEIIPYEDRIALADDAAREAQVIANQQAATAKAQRDTAQNALYLNLLDGKAGQVDIDNARADGTLNDYDSVNKAAKILKERDAETNLATTALTKLQTAGSVWDPTDTDDKKMLNALVGKNGLQRVAQGDQNYISDGIVPLVNQTGDIPTDIAGTLTGMLRGANNGQAMFALDALAQLQDTNELAFNQRVDNDVAQAVDLWQARKDTTSQEELLGMIRGGNTQAERQARQVLRKEAQDLLSKTEGGVPVIKTLLADAIEGFDGYFSSAPHIYSAPVAQQALQKEFQTQFIDAYSKVGNVEAATEMAQKELARNWAVTSVGDGKTLMKYPPEKVGYKPIGGDYDWINKQVRQDLGYKEDQGFELFSDEQTRQEFQKFKSDPNAAPPSYRIFTIDDNGVARENLDKNGQPIRLNFKPAAEDIARDNAIYDWRAEQARLEETIQNYRMLRAGAEVSGKEVPPEDTEEYERAKEGLDALIKNPPNREKPDKGFNVFEGFSRRIGDY